MKRLDAAIKDGLELCGRPLILNGDDGLLNGRQQVKELGRVGLEGRHHCGHLAAADLCHGEGALGLQRVVLWHVHAVHPGVKVEGVSDDANQPPPSVLGKHLNGVAVEAASLVVIDDVGHGEEAIAELRGHGAGGKVQRRLHVGPRHPLSPHLAGVVVPLPGVEEVHGGAAFIELLDKAAHVAVHQRLPLPPCELWRGVGPHCVNDLAGVEGHDNAWHENATKAGVLAVLDELPGVVGQEVEGLVQQQHQRVWRHNGALDSHHVEGVLEADLAGPSGVTGLDKVIKHVEDGHVAHVVELVRVGQAHVVLRHGGTLWHAEVARLEGCPGEAQEDLPHVVAVVAEVGAALQAPDELLVVVPPGLKAGHAVNVVRGLRARRVLLPAGRHSGGVAVAHCHCLIGLQAEVDGQAGEPVARGEADAGLDGGVIDKVGEEGPQVAAADGQHHPHVLPEPGRVLVLDLWLGLEDVDAADVRQGVAPQHGGLAQAEVLERVVAGGRLVAGLGRPQRPHWRVDKVVAL